jgi:hypothetical protein
MPNIYGIPAACRTEIDIAEDMPIEALEKLVSMKEHENRIDFFQNFRCRCRIYE